MIRHVHIVGNNGNMGRRYKAILDFLKIPNSGHDKDSGDLEEGLDKAEGFLVCTPTERHLKDIEDLLFLDKPILCEKPLCKSSEELEAFLRKHTKKTHLISMVNQYKFLPHGDPAALTGTYYDYFKTGSDGLYWDCINIIGLSKKDPVIRNKSPIWTCIINDLRHDLKDMDSAYIKMLETWLRSDTLPVRDWMSMDMNYALMAHKEVERCLTFSS